MSGNHGRLVHADGAPCRRLPVFFYSLENGEPPHVHVTYGSKTAKYWLTLVELASSDGFRAHELNRLRDMVLEHRAEFLERWNEHFRQPGPRRP